MLSVYLASIIRTFALSLSGIFVPIYIYKLFTGALWYEALIQVVYYYLLLEVSSFLLTIPAARLILKLGFRYSIFLGNLLLAVKIGTLVLAKSHPAWLIVSAICDGASIHFFWNCYHLTFAKKSSGGKLGRQVSLDGVFGRLVTALAPAFGGMVVTLFGFSSLLWLSFTLVLVSSFPLAGVVDGRGYILEKGSAIWQALISKKYRLHSLGFFLDGARSYLPAITYPLFLIALVKGSYDSLGFLTSAALFVSIIFHFFAGHFVDNGTKDKAFTLGALLTSFLWLLRIPIEAPYQVFALDSLGGVAESLYAVPWGALIYQNLQKSRAPYLFIVIREITLRMGSILGLVLIFFLAKNQFPLQTSFIFTALFSLVMLSVVKIFKE